MRTRYFLLGYIGLVALVFVACCLVRFEPAPVRPKGVTRVSVPLDAENHVLCQKLAPQLANCHVPAARKSEFAYLNRPITRWNASVLSAKSAGDGWEATICVRPFLGGTYFTTHTTVETWHISNEGTMMPLNVASGPGIHALMRD